nr:BTAD domain-containing putative transcriptional regulator [Kineosporia babensis]
MRGFLDEAELHLGPPKQRTLLALMLVRAGQPVSLPEIVDLIWGEDPPDTVVNVIHRHVAAVRRTLEPGLPARTQSRWVTRVAAGYRLDLPPDTLDLTDFRALVQQTEDAPAPQAARLLVQALSMWHGPVVADLTPEAREHPAFVAVEAEYLAAIRRAADLAQGAGTAVAGDLLPILRQAAARHPLDEAVQARLMLLLGVLGRTAEAMDLFEVLRSRLGTELGLTPGPELRAAQRTLAETMAATGELPVGTPTPTAAPAPDVTTPSVAPPLPSPSAEQPKIQATDGTLAWVRPAQLPADLAWFTGRRHELDAVTSLLSEPDAAAAPRLVVISGMGGVGKTTLAVHWAHQVADYFPDGQLYVNLRGFHPSGAVMGPAETLRSFLDALGVPRERIPAQLEAQAALYRSLMAERRMLILLDNARDSEHVRHLLPGTTGSLVIVTSRNQLIDLVATEGARPVGLDPLPRSDAWRFLETRLGADRTALESAAADEVIELSGRLPLTLALVCAHVAVNPARSLENVAASIREIGGLDSFSDSFSGETAPTDVRSVFSWSYHALSEPAARLFRLFGQHPGPDCSLAAVLSLADRARPEIWPALGELLRASLIYEARPGRFGCHELLRAYAGELAAVPEHQQESADARARLLDHYLHSADAAAATLTPSRDRLALPTPVTGTRPQSFGSTREAAAWLEAERPALVAVIRQDQRYGSARHTWQLAAVIENYLDRAGSWQVQVGLQTLAREAAQRSADLLGTAHASRALGFAQFRLGLDQEATRSLTQALALFDRLEDSGGRAYTRRQLAFQANGRGDHRTALAHYRVAATLYRESGDVSGQGWVHNEVGWTHILLGEYDQALTECLASIDLHRDVGNRNGEAAALDSLGFALHHLDRPDEALDSYYGALGIYRQIADRYLEADTLVHIGDSHLKAGRSAEAVLNWEDALEILQDMGHPDAGAVRDKVSALSVGRSSVRWQY